MRLERLIMTSVSELIQLREEILTSSKGQDGFIDEQMVLTEALQLMFDAKLVDSEAYEDTYFKSGENNTKLNGYAINESQEGTDFSGSGRFHQRRPRRRRRISF